MKPARQVLAAYASVVFSRSPWVGAILLAASAVDLYAVVLGLSAIGSVHLATRALGLHHDPEVEALGPYNALLAALSIRNAMMPGLPAFGLVVMAAFLVVLVVAAWLSTVAPVAKLPVLALPYLVVSMAAATSVSFLGVARPHVTVATNGWLPEGLAAFLSCLGSLLYAPSIGVGALLFVALVVHSRAAAVFAVTGFMASAAFLASANTPASVAEVAHLNAVLTCVCIGTVWFVPSWSALGVAVASAVVAAWISVALAAPLARLGLSASILPFHLATFGVLLALRRRLRDAAPKSVDFIPGTPEENLAYERLRTRRTAASTPISFLLPFRGRWTCTQGVDGKHTHQGIWRHAYDFEVQGEEGLVHSARGERVQDYHCFGLPVLAMAAGTVVAIESNVPDGPIGSVDLERNWGNYVLVYHAPGIYSLVAHLARGSVRVKVGQPVAPGEVVAAAGCSGRSPVPHLHVQLQSGPALGAPTIPLMFADAVLLGKGLEESAVAALVPAAGQSVRPIEPDAQLAACMEILPGAELRFSTQHGAIATDEACVAELDVWGRYVLRSVTRGAALYQRPGRHRHWVLDAVGDEESVISMFRVALPTLPFDGREGLVFSDTLPPRRFRRAWLRWLYDIVEPFIPGGELIVDYRLCREEGVWCVRGASRKRRRGVPVLQTCAWLDIGGPTRIEVTTMGDTRTAVRVPSRTTQLPPAPIATAPRLAA